MNATKWLDRACQELARYSDNGTHMKIPGPSAGWAYELSIELRKIAAALRESEELRRDAERFAWLRDNPGHRSVPYFEDGKWHAPYLVSNAGGSGCGVGLRTYETLGDAIDAARKEGV